MSIYNQLAAGMRKPISISDWWLTDGITSSDLIAAYQPKGAASLSASYVDLSGNGGDTVLGVAPTLDADGWVFTGTEFLGIAGGTVFPQAAWSQIIRFSHATSGNQVFNIVCGTFDNSRRFYLSPIYSPSNRIYGYGATSGVIAGSLSSGIMALAANLGYLNGVHESTGSTNFSPPVEAMCIGRQSFVRDNYNFFGKVQAYALYNKTLTAAQVATITAAMAAL